MASGHIDIDLYAWPDGHTSAVSAAAAGLMTSHVCKFGMRYFMSRDRLHWLLLVFFRRFKFVTFFILCRAICRFGEYSWIDSGDKLALIDGLFLGLISFLDIVFYRIPKDIIAPVIFPIRGNDGGPEWKKTLDKESTTFRLIHCSWGVIGRANWNILLKTYVIKSVCVKGDTCVLSERSAVTVYGVPAKNNENGKK